MKIEKAEMRVYFKLADKAENIQNANIEMTSSEECIFVLLCFVSLIRYAKHT